MKRNKIINKILSIKGKDIYNFLRKIKELLYKFWTLVWKKILDFASIIAVFILVSWIYYIFTWINHSKFTYNQIEEFINKDLPNDNFETLIYRRDMKWYGEDSLIILTKSNMDDLDETPFSQKHMDKIYIFDKLQKWPLEKLLFWGDIYKKTYVVEFPVRCVSEWEDFEIMYWVDCSYEWLEEMDTDLYSYHYSKQNNFIWNVRFFELDDRNNIIVSFYTPQWMVNPTDFWYYIISYDIKTWYHTLPLIHDFGSHIIDDDWNFLDSYSIKEYPQIWLYNKDYKMFINDNLIDIRLSSIDMNSWEIIFKDDNTFELRVFDFNTCEGNGKWYPWVCNFYKLKYKLYEDVFYKNDSDSIKYIEKWTEEYNKYHKIWQQ